MLLAIYLAFLVVVLLQARYHVFFARWSLFLLLLLHHHFRPIAPRRTTGESLLLLLTLLILFFFLLFVPSKSGKEPCLEK